MKSTAFIHAISVAAVFVAGCAAPGPSPSGVRPPSAVAQAARQAAPPGRAAAPAYAAPANAGTASDAIPSSTSLVEPVAMPQVSELLMYAMSLIGVKYRYGGNSAETGFDCSGFVGHVFAASAAIELPRSAAAMSRRGSVVPQADLAPGDLVFYNTLGRRYSHVGIYIGDGRFIHAPSRRKSVEIVDMNNSYWKRRFNGARRVLDDNARLASNSGDNGKAANSADK